jgi:hypothetical protein
MNRQSAPSVVVTLHLAGPIEVAKQWLRAECLREGLCVTIEPELFIYTGGEETGYRVGLVNYPRFPSSTEVLMERAESILAGLIEATHQHSGLLVGPGETVWLSRRPN